MRRRTRIAISVVTGLAAAAISVLNVEGVKSEAAGELARAMERYGGETVEVCVAARDIEAGEVLDEGNVLTESWVTGLLPREAATEVREVTGKTVTSRIPKGAVVCEAYLEALPSSIEVPSGKVAVSVACDESHAVGGAIASGDEVDVYVSKDSVADRLTSGFVLETSTQAAGSGQLAWVTLAVDQEAVGELLAAMTRGQVTLTAPGELAQVGKNEDERAE